MSLLIRLHFNEENKFFPNNHIGKTYIDISNALYVPNNGDFVSFTAEDYVKEKAVAGKLQDAMDEGGSFRSLILGVTYESCRTLVNILLFSDENYIQEFGNDYKKIGSVSNKQDISRRPYRY